MGTGSTNFASMFFRDFGITGGSYNGGSATYQIIELGGTLAYGQLDHFLCSNFGAANSSARGLYVSSFHGTVAFSGFDGCGGTAVEIPSGGSLVVFQDSFEDSKFIQLQIDNGAGNVTSYGGTAYQPSPQSAGTSSNPVVMQLGGTFYMVNGDGIYSNGYTGTNLMGLRMTTNAGTFHCNGANVSFSGTGTGGVGVQIDTAAQTIYSSGCGFLAPSGQQGFILNSSTATVFDGGLNQFQNGQGWAILAGNVIGQANSANLIPLTTAKLVLSAGWGSTATKTAITGGDFPVQFTITNSGTGQGASPTITYTFPQVLASAPYNCTATQTGGTNAVGTFTSSSLSNTGVTFTFSLTPTASSTEIVQVTCVTP